MAPDEGLSPQTQYDSSTREPKAYNLPVKSFFRLVLLALFLLVVAMVSALTAMRFAVHGREVSMPNFTGATPAEARRVAEQNGLQIDVERQYYSATIPEGRILSQLPPAGTKVRRGWEVRVAQSLGPQRVEIPNLLGDSQRAADISIQRRGLNIGAIAQLEVPGTPADQVLSQSPPANANGVSAPKISLLISDSAAASGVCHAEFCRSSNSGAPCRPCRMRDSRQER